MREKFTTIGLPVSLVEELEKLKTTDENTYWRVIRKLLNDAKKKAFQQPETPRREAKKKSASIESEGANTSSLWETWRSAYFNRYGVEHARNAKINSQLVTLRKRLGNDAEEVIKFYLLSNDAFILQTKHSIDFLVKNAETWHSRWQLGQATISYDLAKKAERMSTYDEQVSAIRSLIKEMEGRLYDE